MWIKGLHNKTYPSVHKIEARKEVKVVLETALKGIQKWFELANGYLP